MLDIRYILVILVIGTFMLVTVGHVANYAGSFEVGGWTWLGVPYAIAVDVAIVVCAMLSRWKGTRRWANVGYVGFAAASGAMNVAAVRPWSHPWPDFIFSFIYALFPTGAIMLLGTLARDTEELSEKAKEWGILAQLSKRFAARVTVAKSEPKPEPQAENQPTFRSDKEYVSYLHKTQPELTPKQIKEKVGCSAATVSRGWNNGHDPE